MSIAINKKLCIGCGACVEICPGSLPILRNGKALLPRPERCWGCCSCLKDCPVQAIALYIGDDIGGRMTVKKDGHRLRWIAALADGTEKIITVDSRDANKY
ncbi:MAG: ferredoxin family protein [Oscillospiraceae bacterium]|jgi:adenylylsulfate reductase subunit B|nr:ferredoxin family protein [Oscillospiraceae bacterium]